MSYAIEIKGVYKSFPGVQALTDISLNVAKGEIHAVVGENGAGKSTLMKILGGLYPADAGTILLEGREIAFHSVREAIAAGVSVIYQEFNLMPDLSVAENILVSQPPVYRRGILSKRALVERTRSLLDQLGIALDPGILIEELSVSERQVVEIAKALSFESGIIIMDEPTAALSSKEVERLYAIIAALKAKGKTILYITHRLKEIFDLSDRVTVLRDGKLVATLTTAETDEDTIVRHMVGRDKASFYHYEPAPQREVLLELKGLTKDGYFEDVSFTVRSGEILGLAGLIGCGRDELAKAVYGLLAPDRGEILISGHRVRIRRPQDALRHGIAFLAEDRKEFGIFAEMNVKENLTLTIINRLKHLFGFIQTRAEHETFRRYVDLMQIRCAGAAQRVMDLSGGNQQKVMLGRALATDCRVLLLLEPTRGVDVGAKSEIYTLLHQLAKKGIAILLASSDLPEILSVCDRTVVLWQGRITGRLSKAGMDENAVMRCATGIHVEAAS